MAFIPAVRRYLKQKKGDQSGIALFMVISAISILSILVTEFTYISEVNQMIAYGSLDQIKAHYLAKSGLKLSLLRLKAYQKVTSALGAAGGAAATMAPKSMIQKIWSFPFFYPIPADIPGLSPTDKDSIIKFQKDSAMEGKYSALIESESSKLNLNSLLASYASPQSSPSPTPTQTGAVSVATPTPTPSPSAGGYNAQDARESLYEFLNQILAHKFETDPDFAAFYRDFKLADLVDQIIAWVDRSYQRTTAPSLDKVPMKQAPYYSLREILMLPTMDDELYQLFAPSLTVNPTSGLNINTINEFTLKAIVPEMIKEELAAFFKYRDDPENDHQFKEVKDFYDYLTKNVAAFRGDSKMATAVDTRLSKRNIRLVTDETDFKITIRAQLNQAAETIEAWVSLGDSSNPSPSPSPGAQPTPTPSRLNPTSPSTSTTSSATVPDAGLRINFMRIL